MKKAYAIVITAILVFSIIQLQQITTVTAAGGQEKVYIICISGVGGWTFPDLPYDPEETRDGAISAMKFGEKEGISFIHSAYGKGPPYYGVSYSVVTGWGQYRTIIESYEEVVVINTHGEILPVPYPYNREGWIDEIAEAMLERRITWVHTAGYPFYYTWTQGDTAKQLWGENGFKNLMSNINLNNTNCNPVFPEGELIDITLDAEDYLDSGWPSFKSKSYWVSHGRPLKSSDFASNLVFSLWGTDYYTGAVIAFLKPSQRMLGTRNFGAYVHIGTTYTYDERGVTIGSPHYWRGYDGAAAALWLMTSRCKTSYGECSQDYGGGYSTCGSLTVTPVVRATDYNPGTLMFEVDLGFGIYGKIRTNAGASIAEAHFHAGNMPEDCTMMMRKNFSANGFNYQHSTIAYFGLPPSSWKLIAQTALFFVSFYEFGPIGQMILYGLDGGLLFSDWYDISSSVTNPQHGIDQVDSQVMFEYQPQTTTSNPGDGYTYQEFQSMIYIQVEAPTTNRQQWSILPIEFDVWMRLSDGVYVCMYGDVSIAMYYKNYSSQSYEATVFFEQFNDLSGWSHGDTNSLNGYDYWGLSFGNTETWCAAVGGNPQYYDDNMNTYLTRSVNLRPYRSTELHYRLSYWIQSGDYLAVEYYTDSVWNTSKTYTGTGWGHDAVFIPNTANMIRFRFYSNNDGSVSYGAYIDYVWIEAQMPNDADQQRDAPNQFGQTGKLKIGISDTLTTYGGYLNYDDDWYCFDITSQNISNQKLIFACLSSPANSVFKLQLYDPNNNLKCDPQSGLISYTLQPSDPPGEWFLRIYPDMGFGPYELTLYLTQGGGCPYLYAWNGDRYVLDNNLLPKSENNNGNDVEDYYKLEQTLAPIFQGSSFSLYSLRIGEFESEHSYLDKADFLAVDHDSNTKIAVTSNGEILTYQNPHSPFSCFNKEGNDMLHLINVTDDQYYTGEAGDYLLLDFGDLDTQNGAKLVLRADAEHEKWSIHVQVLNATENWETIATVIPRVYWATEIVDLSDFLPDLNNELKVRLLFTSNHKIDFIGLDTTMQSNYEIYNGTLILAIHSSNGLVTWKLRYDDNTYAELTPGQHIALNFLLPNTHTDRRTFIIYLEGHYYTIIP